MANTQTIGIIGAMDEEVAILKEMMTTSETVERAGMTFYKGIIDGQAVVISRSGIGKVNAAVCTQLMITLFDIDCLINSGVAGTLHPDLNQGDIVISTDAVQHDMDTTVLGDPLGEIPRLGITFFQAEEKLINLMENVAGSLDLEGAKIFKGRVASGDQFVAGGALKDRIQAHFAPFAVEMEGAAIAHVAHLNKVPFVIIRSISDKADGGAELSYEAFLPLAVKNATLLIEAFIKNYA